MPARRIPPPSTSFAAYTSAGDTDAGSRPARTIVASLTCDASDGIDLASLRATGATTRSHHGRSLLTSFSYRSRGSAAARTASRRLGTAIAGRKIAMSRLKTAAEVARAPSSGSNIGLHLHARHAPAEPDARELEARGDRQQNESAKARVQHGRDQGMVGQEQVHKEAGYDEGEEACLHAQPAALRGSA